MTRTMANVEILRAACCVAGLDKEISEKEKPMLKKLADYAGVGAASLNAMIDRARRDPNFYQEQFKLVSADPAAALTVLFTVACADGALTQSERVILRHFADKLKLDDERFNQILESAERKVSGTSPAKPGQA